MYKKLLAKINKTELFTPMEKAFLENAINNYGTKPRALYTYADEFNVDEEVEKAIDYIDFEHIHRMMVADDWVWWDRECGYSIPSVDLLKKRCEELLREALSHDDESEYSVATGGFNCGFRVYGNDKDDKRPDTFENNVDVYVEFKDEEYSSIM